MSIAGDLTLLATDPVTGTFRLASSNPTAVFAGAHLIDLVQLGRVDTIGERRRAKVQVLDRTPTGRPDVDHALSRLKDRPVSISSAISRMGHQGRQRAYAALEQEHRVRSRTERVLLFEVTRHDVVDTERRDRLVRDVRAVLVEGAEPDATTGPLVSLLAAVSQLRLVVERSEHRAAKARAKQVSAEDWASEAVRRAVAGAEAAVTAAIIGATTAAAAGAS